MNEQEQERYESELRRISPAPLPANFMARLQTARPNPQQKQKMLFPSEQAIPIWRRVMLWLAPALAVILAVFFVARARFAPKGGAQESPAYGLKADGVQVDQELVSSFDVVATLPDGQPVRFRCRQWKDQLTVTDKNLGVQIEQRSPRVEVMPVRFETY